MSHGSECVTELRPRCDAKLGPIYADFAELLAWLRKNVHRHGRNFTPNELLERATGRPLTAAPWIAYVQRKFCALYGLQTVSR